MKLQKISLVNFRNYEKLSLKFNPHVTIFIGKNAQGKTNLLESIYMLALTKSNRKGLEENFIRFGSYKAKIKGTIKQDRIYKDLEVQLFNQSKKVFYNNNEIRKISDYISYMNVILFTPDDLDIIKGSPSVRRNLLNVEISQISKKYLNAHNLYNKLLKTRNEYLKLLYTNSLSDETYLNILTEKLIDQAITIYQERHAFLEQINENIASIYEQITGFKNLKIKYLPNLEISSFVNEDIAKTLEKKLNSNRKKEEILGTTLYGPHRDDFAFYLNDKDLKVFGSQGQQRLAVIAFKLAEITIFYKKTNTYPILLLDDLFSEIDRSKKNQLLKYISGEMQTIITATDLSDMKKSLLEDATIYEVKNGIIREKVGNKNGRK